VELALDTTKNLQNSMLWFADHDQEYEPEVCRFLKQVLTPGDCFIDVGAHIGYFTILASRLVESGKVYSFEPENYNHQCLLDNIKLNGFTNVTAFQKCVGDKEAEVELFVNLDNDGGHSLWWPGQHPANTRTRESERTAQRVGMVTLDSVVDFVPKAIKIDAEGSELLVIKGAERLIRQHKPMVIMEMNYSALMWMGTSKNELADYMDALGYATYMLETGDIVDLKKIDNGQYVFNVVFISLPPHLIKAAQKGE
jgi:FkbM family methyltransferase